MTGVAEAGGAALGKVIVLFAFFGICYLIAKVFKSIGSNFKSKEFKNRTNDLITEKSELQSLVVHESTIPTNTSTASFNPPTTRENTHSMTAQPSTASAMNVPEAMPEEIWATALAEFDSSSRRPGLWAKVFAESQGNEATAKASYLRARATELYVDEQNRIQEKERLSKQAMLEAEQVRRLEEKRAYELLPKGTCPNSICRNVMPLSYTKCDKCRASFEGSGWKLIPLDEK